MQTLTKPKPATQPPPEGVLHIDLTDDADAVLFEMFCGACCHAAEDGTLTPPLDHYSPTWGHKATCEPCLAAWRAAGCPASRGW